MNQPISWKSRAISRLFCIIALAVAPIACGGSSPTSPAPSKPSQSLDRVAVIEALEYWQAAVQISYELIDSNVEPRLLIRPGTDGLAPQGGGRGLIDGTYPDNSARSGLVVFETGGGQYCQNSAAWCRYLYRHEIGHALGFLDHSNAGLMNATPDGMTDRERRMMVGLYSLPLASRVDPDGRWSGSSTGLSGRLDDLQAAQDVIAWNMNAKSGASYRQQGITTRWSLPVRVYLQLQ